MNHKESVRLLSEEKNINREGTHVILNVERISNRGYLTEARDQISTLTGFIL